MSGRRSDRILDQGLDLQRDMAHRTGGDDLNCRLHGNSKLLVHLDGDVLDSGLCDAN